MMTAAMATAAAIGPPILMAAESENEVQNVTYNHYEIYTHYLYCWSLPWLPLLYWWQLLMMY